MIMSLCSYRIVEHRLSQLKTSNDVTQCIGKNELACAVFSGWSWHHENWRIIFSAQLFSKHNCLKSYLSAYLISTLSSSVSLCFLSMLLSFSSYIMYFFYLFTLQLFVAITL